jgi:flagellar biosynthesis protein
MSRNGSNPRHTGRQKAAALIYRRELPAPLVAAKGSGITAQRIIDSAKASGVPVIRNNSLAEQLNEVDLGDFIPPETFLVVADLLKFVQNIHTTKVGT